MHIHTYDAHTSPVLFYLHSTIQHRSHSLSKDAETKNSISRLPHYQCIVTWFRGSGHGIRSCTETRGSIVNPPVAYT